MIEEDLVPFGIIADGQEDEVDPNKVYTDKEFVQWLGENS